MSIVCGIDSGSTTTKVILMEGKRILGYAIGLSGTDCNLAAKSVLSKALSMANASFKDINSIISTGYGRRAITFANKFVTEITCHGAGAKLLYKEAGLIIDIGGQDSKAILLNDEGVVEKFLMNDKCAAGTGRFLEVMASRLGIEMSELGNLVLKAEAPVQLNSTCTVFAESEIISVIARKVKKEDIAAGIHQSVARRVSGLAKRLEIREKVVFTGGVAKNIGMIKALEKELQTNLHIPKEPQLVGAIGAAYIAQNGNE